MKTAITLLSFILISCVHLFGQTVSTIAHNFSASGGIRVDADGNILVADFGQDFNATGTDLFKISPSGDVSLFSTSLRGATGGNFDSQRRLFWSSFGGNRVDVIDENGNVSLFATVRGPVAIAVDTSDNVFVASCSNNSIIRITPQGQISTFVSSNLFNCANGMTFDDQGNLYVSNFNDGRVIRVHVNLPPTVFATVPGNNSVNLAFNNGFIYVAVRAAHAIYRIPIDGNNQPELFAGRPNVRGNDDGTALQATFSFPNSIGVSPDGTKLYVNDVDASSSTFHPTVLREIVLDNATSVEERSSKIPDNFVLEQNYPNPFNPTTNIRYELQSNSRVLLSIYNTIGEQVKVLIDEPQTAGAKTAAWNGRDDRGKMQSSGVYIFKIQIEGRSESKKMLLLK